MAGDGPLLSQLREPAAAAGVQLLGRCEDVPALLRTSDVLMFTSVPEGEGMPGVFIEAGLTGLPVVTTDVPGARTVIKDDETGFIVPPTDPSALVLKTKLLLEQTELRARMGKLALERCLREFTLERSTSRWATLLDDLASGHSES
jgi:glycosyltransferase involved in cell wall biosynthesis